ncbi:MAG: hypothetical protein MJB12_14995, partial [Firmicutes bacterium]|nr:hypothetical protein [Bacillota bacterium]
PDDPNGIAEFNLVTRYYYDALDNRIQTTDPKGNKLYTDYDNANRKTKTYFATDNAAKVVQSQTEYYDNDQVKRVTEFDRDGSTVLKDTEFSYDYRRRLQTVFQDIDGTETARTDIYYNDLDPLEYLDPNNPIYYPVEFADKCHFDIRIDDGEGKSTWRRFDHNKKLVEILYPSGLHQRWGYYPDGKLKAKTVYDSSGNHQCINYRRDGYGRVITKDYPDGNYVKYDYDYFDRMIYAGEYITAPIQTDPNLPQEPDTLVSEYNYTYTPFNQIETITDQDGFISSYSYKSDGQVDNIHITGDPVNDPNGIYVADYEYDRAGRLYIIMSGTAFEDFSMLANYDDNGNLSNMGYRNGGLFPFTEIDYTYNLDNQLDSLSNAYFSLGNMVIDGKGRIKSAQSFRPNQAGVDEYYTYNRLGELTQAIVGSWAGNYGYNKDGNMNNRTENGVSEDFGYDFNNTGFDDTNMLTSVGSNDLVDWDKNGNLICDGISTFTYNFDNKIEASANIIDPDITTFMSYDSMSNRVMKTVTDETGAATTRKYILDYSGKLPKVLVELEYDGEKWNPVAKNYHYGDRLFHSKHANVIGGFDSRYYIHDRNGSVRS